MTRQPLYRKPTDPWLRVQVLETNIPGFESWLHSFLVSGFWGKYLTWLHFRVSIYNLRINDKVYFVEVL